MSPLFLDASYVVALRLRRDQNHAAAQRHWRAFGASPPRLVTTTLVFGEVVTFLSRRGQHRRAVEVGSWLLTSPSVQLVQVDAATFVAAWSEFQRLDDQRVSLADCASFHVMRQRRLTTALTFDRHFATVGFLVQP